LKPEVSSFIPFALTKQAIIETMRSFKFERQLKKEKEK